MRKLEQAALALDRSMKNIPQITSAMMTMNRDEMREQEHRDVSGEAYRESGPVVWGTYLKVDKSSLPMIIGQVMSEVL